jgi:hypothetical protein
MNGRDGLQLVVDFGALLAFMPQLGRWMAGLVPKPCRVH